MFHGPAQALLTLSPAGHVLEGLRCSHQVHAFSCCMALRRRSETVREALRASPISWGLRRQLRFCSSFQREIEVALLSALTSLASLTSAAVAAGWRVRVLRSKVHAISQQHTILGTQSCARDR